MPSRSCRPNHYFFDNQLHLRILNILCASIQSICCTSDVASTNGTGVLSSRVWIIIFLTRHLKEQE